MYSKRLSLTILSLCSIRKLSGYVGDHKVVYAV